MRVAVATRIFPAVSQTFVSDHAAGLLRRGHEIEVLCAHDERRDGRRILADGLVHEWSSPRKSLARDLWAAGRRAPSGSVRLLPKFLTGPSARWWHFTWWSLVQSRPPFEVIHAHFAGQGESLAWLRAQGLLHTPLVVSMHGFDVTPHAQQGRNPYPSVFAHADRVVATTAFMGEQVLRLGCPPEKLALIPTGIHLEAFTAREVRWQPGETLRLLSVTRLVEVKGIRHAIEAVSQLAANGVDVEYTVAGDGPLRQELEALTAHHGVTGRIHFRGALPRQSVLQEYARNHLLLFPSCTSADGQAEAQGIATMEAQACGLPVIATRHGGIPEVVRDGETGMLVAEADADALALGIRAMLARAADWPAMGRVGRAWIERQFTLDRHLQRLEDLYRTLLPH